MPPKATGPPELSDSEKVLLEKYWTIDTDTKIQFYNGPEDDEGKMVSEVTHLNVIERMYHGQSTEFAQWFTDSRKCHTVDWKKNMFSKTITVPRLSQFTTIHKISLKLGISFLAISSSFRSPSKWLVSVWSRV